jgi:ATP-binding cassette subfamily B protein
MANIFDFFELKPQMSQAARKDLPVRLKTGIEFRGVGFRYPDSEEWALRDVDLSIRAGEKIALDQMLALP